ncbi:Uncharacterised protein [uncultured archaeon]|nr:Uncharacterised protein [uncultured archaeon]
MQGKDDKVCFIDGEGKITCPNVVPKHARRVSKLLAGAPLPPPGYLVTVNGKLIGTTFDSGDAFIGNVFVPITYKNQAEAVTEAMKHSRDSVEAELAVLESYGSFPEDKTVVWNQRMVLGRKETNNERGMRRIRETREALELQNRIEAEENAEYKTVVDGKGRSVRIKQTW